MKAKSGKLKPPVIAIVGRPNVGKSTLFNRVVGLRRAVVEDTPGVTRDRNYAFVEDYEIPFVLVDTGGFEEDPSSEIDRLVREQTDLAIDEADAIIAVFDGNSGVHPSDVDLVTRLRRTKHSPVYVVNKCDGKEQAVKTADFYSLGLDEFFDVSALHGRGVRQLVQQTLSALPNYDSLCASARAKQERDEASEEEARLELEREGIVIEEEVEDSQDADALSDSIEVLEEIEEEPAEPVFAPVYVPGGMYVSETDYLRTHKVKPLEYAPSPSSYEGLGEERLAAGEEVDELNVVFAEPPTIDCIKVCIIGKPNVGKSTLLNTLTGEQRAITSPVAGTTRDSVDLKIRREAQDYLIVDTAGLRRKAKVDDKLEKYSVMRALNVLTRSDVAVVVIDAQEGVNEQDAKIVGMAHDQGKGIVIAVNKWDLVEKDHKTVREFSEHIRAELKFAPYAPIVFVSALTGRRCPRIIEQVRGVAYERLKRFSTPALNRLLKRSVRRKTLPMFRGRPIKLYYGTQVDVAPPRIVLFFNYPKALHFSYLRYLKNCIREIGGFEGTDLKIVAKKQ